MSLFALTFFHWFCVYPCFTQYFEQFQVIRVAWKNFWPEFLWDIETGSDQFNSFRANLANSYLFKVNKGNIRKRCEIYSKLTIKAPERCSDVFIVNFEHISHVFLVFLLLNLNTQMLAGNVPIISILQSLQSLYNTEKH